MAAAAVDVVEGEGVLIPIAAAPQPAHLAAVLPIANMTHMPAHRLLLGATQALRGQARGGGGHDVRAHVRAAPLA